ncbi:MAG TPA: hypothetical protein VGQ49_10840 [Bryobacteraceae bacterium]|jgi:hypothetical protein|nr:hypothetical protein [Bryobacteraceae bacterium]
MKWICVMSAVLAVAAATTAQSACPVPPGAVKISVPSGLPTALRHALPGDIALPDEPFDSTDVYVKENKHRRYMFVWNIGNRWIVVVEQGGKALRAAISTYDLGKDDATAVLIEERVTFPHSVCAAATKLAERRNPIGGKN